MTAASLTPALQRQIANTLRSRPALNAQTAMAILQRDGADDAWQLFTVAPPTDTERAVQRREQLGLEATAIRVGALFVS